MTSYCEHGNEPSRYILIISCLAGQPLAFKEGFSSAQLVATRRYCWCLRPEILLVVTSGDTVGGHVRRYCWWSRPEILLVVMSGDTVGGHVRRYCWWSCPEILLLFICPVRTNNCHDTPDVTHRSTVFKYSDVSDTPTVSNVKANGDHAIRNVNKLLPDYTVSLSLYQLTNALNKIQIVNTIIQYVYILLSAFVG